MMTDFPIPKLDWNAENKSNEWDYFKQECETIFTNIWADKKPEQQAGYITMWLGREGLDLINTRLELSAEDKKDPKAIFKALDDYFAPRCHFRTARLELSKMVQEPGETVDSFVTRLKVCAKNCQLKCMHCKKDTTDRVIDQLIAGVSDEQTQKDLLGKDAKLTLDDAIKAARENASSKSRETGSIQSIAIFT